MTLGRKIRRETRMLLLCVILTQLVDLAVMGVYIAIREYSPNGLPLYLTKAALIAGLQNVLRVAGGIPAVLATRRWAFRSDLARWKAVLGGVLISAAYWYLLADKLYAAHMRQDISVLAEGSWLMVAVWLAIAYLWQRFVLFRGSIDGRRRKTEMQDAAA